MLILVVMALDVVGRWVYSAVWHEKDDDPERAWDLGAKEGWWDAYIQVCRCLWALSLNWTTTCLDASSLFIPSVGEVVLVVVILMVFIVGLCGGVWW